MDAHRSDRVGELGQGVAGRKVLEPDIEQELEREQTSNGVLTNNHRTVGTGTGRTSRRKQVPALIEDFSDLFSNLKHVYWCRMLLPGCSGAELRTFTV